MATGSEIKDIVPDEALEVCARQIIVSYFHEMLSYKEGAKEGTDIGFVHDMRVTSRRLRAVMDNFADCFPKSAVQKTLQKGKGNNPNDGSRAGSGCPHRSF